MRGRVDGRAFGGRRGIDIVAQRVNEVENEVDIGTSEGPAVAAWSLLEASGPPVDLSGTCCSGPLDHVKAATD